MLKDIIKDQNQTIARLQQECTEKTDLIESLTTKLNFTTRQYEALHKKYAEVLKLAKENADSYEYCVRDLEKELEELKNAR